MSRSVPLFVVVVQLRISSVQTSQADQSCAIVDKVVGTLLIQKATPTLATPKVTIGEESPVATLQTLPGLHGGLAGEAIRNVTGVLHPDTVRNQPVVQHTLESVGLFWNESTSEGLKDAGYVSPANTECFQWDKDYGNKGKGACGNANVLALHCSEKCILSAAGDHLVQKQTNFSKVSYDSAFQCQQACLLFKDCEHFTFDTNEGLFQSSCWLRDSIPCEPTYADSPGLVSGPASCRPQNARSQLVAMPTLSLASKAELDDPVSDVTKTHKVASDSVSKQGVAVSKTSSDKASASAEVITKPSSKKTAVGQRIEDEVKQLLKKSRKTNTSTHGKYDSFNITQHQKKVTPKHDSHSAAHKNEVMPMMNKPSSKNASTNAASDSLNSSEDETDVVPKMDYYTAKLGKRNDFPNDEVMPIKKASSAKASFEDAPAKKSGSRTAKQQSQEWVVWFWKYAYGWPMFALSSCLVIYMYSANAEKRDEVMESQMDGAGSHANHRQQATQRYAQRNYNRWSRPSGEPVA